VSNPLRYPPGWAREDPPNWHGLSNACAAGRPQFLFRPAPAPPPPVDM